MLANLGSLPQGILTWFKFPYSWGKVQNSYYWVKYEIPWSIWSIFKLSIWITEILLSKKRGYISPSHYQFTSLVLMIGCRFWQENVKWTSRLGKCNVLSVTLLCTLMPMTSIYFYDLSALSHHWHQLEQKCYFQIVTFTPVV